MNEKINYYVRKRSMKILRIALSDLVVNMTLKIISTIAILPTVAYLLMLYNHHMNPTKEFLKAIQAEYPPENEISKYMQFYNLAKASMDLSLNLYASMKARKEMEEKMGKNMSDLMNQDVGVTFDAELNREARATIIDTLAELDKSLQEVRTSVAKL